MATLLSIANGNFTDASTWGVCDATSELDSFAGNASLTSGFAYTQAFTPGAITISGIAIKLHSRTSTAGTLRVLLRNNNTLTTVTGADVTINVTDLMTGSSTVAFGSGMNAWYYFKFASPVTLSAGVPYSVGAAASSNNVLLHRSATASDWCRQLVTTTNAAPAANDKLLICGSKTGVGVGTTTTVTMNNTASTNFGLISICHGGILDFATAAATNYVLKTVGSTISSALYGFEIQNGGTLQIGTSGNKIPVDSTVDIELVMSSNVAFGLRTSIYATFTAYGAEKTAFSLLDTNFTNVIAGQTHARVTDATGWLADDTVAFGSTTKVVTECETRTISGSPSGNLINLNSGVTYTHHADKTTPGEVANLTRNIKIHGTSASLQTFMFVNQQNTFNLNNVEFYWFGSAVSNAEGIRHASQSAAPNVLYTNCVFRDFVVTGSNGIIHGGDASRNMIITNCVFYNIANIAVNVGRNTSGVTATYVTLNNCLLMRQGNATNYYISATTHGGHINLNNVIVSGVYNGFSLTVASPAGYNGAATPWTNVTLHSCSGQPISFTLITGWVATNMKFWACSNPINPQSGMGIVLFDTITIVDCGTSTSSLAVVSMGQVIYRNFIFDGNNSSTYLFQTAANNLDTYQGKIQFQNGIIRNFTSGVIFVQTSVGGGPRGPFDAYEFNNTLFSNVNNTIVASPTQLFYQTERIISQHHNQVPNNYYIAKYFAEISKDTSIYYDNSSSIRLKPYHASNRAATEPFYVAGNAGETINVSVWVRHSVVGDGAAYNGSSQARLMLTADYGMFGSYTDSVLDTAVAANGVWEQLTGAITFTYDGIARVYVDCLGTTGWINVDAFSTDVTNDINNLEKSINGFPLAVNNNLTNNYTLIKRKRQVR